MGVAVGPLVYWITKIQNRRRRGWQLFKPTRQRNVTAVLIVFGAMVIGFSIWWIIGEMWALWPILAVLLPIEWIVVGFLIWRWRREDRAAKPDDQVFRR